MSEDQETREREDFPTCKLWLSEVRPPGMGSARPGTSPLPNTAWAKWATRVLRLHEKLATRVLPTKLATRVLPAKLATRVLTTKLATPALTARFSRNILS